MSKLYVIVLATLSAGLKAAQACHALHAFTQTHPEATRAWEPDNNIVVLMADDVTGLAAMLDAQDIPLARFHEPDLAGALTAICCTSEAKRWVRGLPLAA